MRVQAGESLRWPDNAHFLVVDRHLFAYLPRQSCLGTFLLGYYTQIHQLEQAEDQDRPA